MPASTSVPTDGRPSTRRSMATLTTRGRCRHRALHRRDSQQGANPEPGQGIGSARHVGYLHVVGGDRRHLLSAVAGFHSRHRMTWATLGSSGLQGTISNLPTRWTTRFMPRCGGTTPVGNWLVQDTAIYTAITLTSGSNHRSGQGFHADREWWHSPGRRRPEPLPTSYGWAVPRGHLT